MRQVVSEAVGSTLALTPWTMSLSVSLTHFPRLLYNCTHTSCSNPELLRSHCPQRGWPAPGPVLRWQAGWKELELWNASLKSEDSKPLTSSEHDLSSCKLASTCSGCTNYSRPFHGNNFLSSDYMLEALGVPCEKHIAEDLEDPSTQSAIL